MAILLAVAIGGGACGSATLKANDGGAGASGKGGAGASGGTAGKGGAGGASGASGQGGASGAGGSAVGPTCVLDSTQVDNCILK